MMGTKSWTTDKFPSSSPGPVAVFVDRADTSHNVTYAEICEPTTNPAKPNCHIEKDKPH